MRISSYLESSRLRFPARIARNFSAHRGPVRAASLSYTTLLALVPLLALVLSISKGLVRNQDPQKLHGMIERALDYAVPQLRHLSEAQAEDARDDVLARMREAVDRIDAGALGIFGAITLVSVGITLLSAVEYALNDIWGVGRARSFAQRVVYYWAGVTLGPILIVLALGLTGSGTVGRVLGWIPGGFAATLYGFLLPFAVLGAGFTLLYWTMPNTEVPLRAALSGGLVGGALFQANNLASAIYFSQVVGYSKVYGSVGAIPVLMIGLYVSWTIVLLGAEVAHAVATPASETLPEPEPEGFEAKARIALEVARFAAAEFLSGRSGATPLEAAKALELPVAWVNSAFSALSRAGLFAPSSDAAGAERYLPARPPATISALDVLDSLRRPGGEPAPVAEPAAAVSEFLARLQGAEREAAADVTLEALASSRAGR